jgi:hypothetical protein
MLDMPEGKYSAWTSTLKVEGEANNTTQRNNTCYEN